ncbi:hypothetical protein ALC53_08566, partial [Atta colombica]
SGQSEIELHDQFCGPPASAAVIRARNMPSTGHVHENVVVDDRLQELHLRGHTPPNGDAAINNNDKTVNARFSRSGTSRTRSERKPLRYHLERIFTGRANSIIPMRYRCDYLAATVPTARRNNQASSVKSRYDDTSCPYRMIRERTGVILTRLASSTACSYSSFFGPTRS